MIWFTGLSGSGKTTLARRLKSEFDQMGIKSVLLDGDEIRSGLNSDLGFTMEDRMENIRRVAEIALLLVNSGVFVITSFISPTNQIRNKARKIIGENQFFEIFLCPDMKICESRDVKGLYDKARKNELKDFSGISSPYEIPKNPNLSIDTGNLSIDISSRIIFDSIF